MVRTFESMRHLSLDGTFYVKSQAINALAKAGQQLQEVRAPQRAVFLYYCCPSVSGA